MTGPPDRMLSESLTGCVGLRKQATATVRTEGDSAIQLDDVERCLDSLNQVSMGACATRGATCLLPRTSRERMKVRTIEFRLRPKRVARVHSVEVKGVNVFDC